MRKMILGCALACGLTTVAPAQSVEVCAVTFLGANVWTGEGFERRDLSISDGVFVAEPVTDGPQIPAGFAYFVPPLVDTHTHNLDQPTDRTIAAHRSHLANGIFYALNPNNIRIEGEAPALSANHVEAIYTGGGVTGPGGHPRPLYERLAPSGAFGPIRVEDLPGRAFHEVSTVADARVAIDRIAESGASIAKLYLLDHESASTDGLTAETFRAAVEHAARRGIRTVAHIETAGDFRLAAETGIAAVMHIPGRVPRDGHGDDDYMLTASDAALASANDMAVSVTATVSIDRLSGEQLALAQRYEQHNLRLLRDAGVRITAGADRFGASAVEELTILKATGLFSSADIIEIGTRNGAELLFPNRRIGRLEPGYEASFLMTFANPEQSLFTLFAPGVGMRGGVTIIDQIGILPPGCSEE